jgi:hypothetical protein
MPLYTDKSESDIFNYLSLGTDKSESEIFNQLSLNTDVLSDKSNGCTVIAAWISTMNIKQK